MKRADDGVVAGLAIGLGVEKMTEQKVQRGRLTVSIADGKSTCGALTLSSFQK
jgi:hypothetical protein